MTYERPPTSNQCAICGQPATCSTLKDPWGKSDEMEGRCAKHSPKLRDPDDVALIDRQRAEIERLRETERKFGALMHDVMDERDRLRAALERIWHHPEDPELPAHYAAKLRTIAGEALSGEPSVHETTAELWKRQADFASEREMTALRQLARTPGLIEALEAIAVHPAQREERKLGMSWTELVSRNAKIARDALDLYRSQESSEKASGLCSAHQYPNPGERDYTPTCRICFPQKASDGPFKPNEHCRNVTESVRANFCMDGWHCSSQNAKGDEA